MKTVRLNFGIIKGLLSRISRSTARFAAERIRTLLCVAAVAAIGLCASASGEPETGVKSTGMSLPPGFTGIGPVVSGSVDYNTVPSKARKFLERNCGGHAVVKCNKEFSSGEYEIGLADGIEMEFDSKGQLTEIEAPEGYSLSPQLLRAVVPGKLYHQLEHNGFNESVEAVHRDKAGYRLEISDPVFNQVCYDSSGVLTLVIEK